MIFIRNELIKYSNLRSIKKMSQKEKEREAIIEKIQARAKVEEHRKTYDPIKFILNQPIAITLIFRIQFLVGLLVVLLGCQILDNA